jgi:hypothetical protein
MPQGMPGFYAFARNCGEKAVVFERVAKNKRAKIRFGASTRASLE